MDLGVADRARAVPESMRSLCLSSPQRPSMVPGVKDYTPCVGVFVLLD